MKLVIIGGSALSTPALFLTDSVVPLLRSVDTVLVGRSVQRLQAVQRVLNQLVPQLHVSWSDIHQLERTVSDADVILIQARYGGMQARAYDETFPRRYGIPGDEGLGPGGLSAAWRTWPHLRRALDSIAASAPKAHVVAMTAPLGILTRCVIAEYPHVRWHAVCELPYATLQEIARACDVPVTDIDYDYAGVNHLGWFDGLRDRRTGENLIPRYAERLAAGAFPPASLVRSVRAVPLKYERLAYDAEAVVAEQTRSSRAAELLAWQQRCLRAFESGERGEIISLLSARATPWYDITIGPLIASLGGVPRTEHCFMTVRNEGYIDGFAPGDVLEVPYRCDGGEFVRIERQRKPSRRIYERLEPLVRYEERAADAVRLRDETLLKEALSLHPWVRRHLVDPLAEAIVAPAAVARNDSMSPAFQDSR